MADAPGGNSKIKIRLAQTGRTLQTTSGGRFASDTYGGLRALVRGFRGENISLRASALTYATIFSLVPGLTVALATLRLIPQAGLQERLRGFIQELLAPGIREDTAALLERFIGRASSVAAGWIGFTILAISAGALLMNLDASLNEIWNVRRERKLWVRILIYVVIVLLGPLLVASSLASSSELREAVLQTHLPFTRTMVALSPWVASVFAFTLLFKLAPAASVRVRSAFAGGLVAGLGWQLAQRLYAAFGAEIFRRNPIYGSLGAAPLFLSWIYVSWIIVLFGARLAYAVEHAGYLRVYGHLGDTPRTRELIATQIAHQITGAHYRGQPAPTVRELARALNVPGELVGSLVEMLKRAALLTEVQLGLIPAKPPDQLSVADISRAVDGTSTRHSLPLTDDKAAEFQMVESAFAQIDQAAVRALEGLAWIDLLPDGPKSKSAEPGSEPPPRANGGGRLNL